MIPETVARVAASSLPAVPSAHEVLDLVFGAGLGALPALVLPTFVVLLYRLRLGLRGGQHVTRGHDVALPCRHLVGGPRDRGDVSLAFGATAREVGLRVLEVFDASGASLSLGLDERARLHFVRFELRARTRMRLRRLRVGAHGGRERFARLVHRALSQLACGFERVPLAHGITRVATTSTTKGSGETAAAEPQLPSSAPDHVDTSRSPAVISPSSAPTKVSEVREGVTAES